MPNKKPSRREFIGSAIAGCGAVSLLGCATVPPPRRPSRQPNIIFLLTDDQRWDTMSCMGNHIIHTPNMDNLAHNGVLFTNAFVTTSICCTSRASIFAGQYARRHGIHDFSTHFSPGALAQTYPMMLRHAGYRIGFIGKYGVGVERDFPKDEFDYWRGIPGQPRYEHKDKHGNYKHLTRILGEQSADFLRTCSPNQPFCLSVSFKAPHVEDADPRQFLYDRAYQDLYRNETIPTPKTASPEHLEALPEFLRHDKTEARRRWKRRFSTPEKYQESVKGYYRLVTGVDVIIGEIREQLKQLDLDDNTVIILTGDNGFFLGEHGFAGKWYGHEESIRVPLVVYDPKLPTGQRGQIRKEMALNIDIAPTILALAGINAPERMQGRNLVPLMQGKSVPWRTDFFYEHLFGFGGSIPSTEGVVGKRYKYLRYIDQKPPYEELYDLKIDPHEENNLATNPNSTHVLKAMRDRWRELRRNCK